MKSQYGDRETVGTQYLDAQKNSTEGLLIGDIGVSMVSGLVDDLNEAIESNPFEGKDFYLSVVEERDLQMKNAIKRRIFQSVYRPYPEDNTLVFKVSPKQARVFYCWDIPHHSEFFNILSNQELYDHTYVQNIKNWVNNDLSNFGFIKVRMNSHSTEGYDEKILNAYKKAYLEYCETLQMNQKEIENEKRIGFFWIPNKLYKDAPIEAPKQQIVIMGN